MASDPGRDAPDFPPATSSQHCNTATLQTTAAYQQAAQQFQPCTADRQADVKAPHCEPAVELVGGEEYAYEDELTRDCSVSLKVISPTALSSEQSALKAVLAELHSRSASGSPL